MFHSVSPPLQQGIRFLRRLDPDLQQLALRLACPEGEGAGVPRSAWLLIIDNLGGPGRRWCNNLVQVH